MKTRAIYFILIGIFCCSCQEHAEVAGLWELEEVNIDGWTRKHRPVYLKFDPGNSTFMVSRQHGDLAGIYSLQNTTLSLHSEDDKYYNTRWNVYNIADEIQLKGLEMGYRTTQLTFKKITAFPSFETFETLLNGRWILYKQDENGVISNVENTHFKISDQTYHIWADSQLVESGHIELDARHQKITFIDADVRWNAWFFGRELRLENKDRGLMYRLKK